MNRRGFLGALFAAPFAGAAAVAARPAFASGGMVSMSRTYLVGEAAAELVPYPTRLVISQPVWEMLQKHPDIVEAMRNQIVVQQEMPESVCSIDLTEIDAASEQTTEMLRRWDQLEEKTGPLAPN